jgi:UDP-glucose 4-epimerase
MLITITGASGNVGTALLRHLAATEPAWELAGLCRRPPRPGDPVYDRVRWIACDISVPEAAPVLEAAFQGSDAVIHLAWLIQPSHDPALLERTNVDGSRRVFEAALAAGVPHLVHASSVGAYSPGPKTQPVDETWPTDGVPTSSYSRHKAAAERHLDALGQDPDAPVIARIRPGLVFQHDAGSGVARYFLGPLAPVTLLGARRLPVVPLPDEAVFQAVHADDVAEGLRRIVRRRAAGAFNLAAQPVLTPARLAEVFHGRRVRLSGRLVRRVVELTWRARLQPTEPGWVDLAFSVPVMSTARARDRLDWVARHDARFALADLLDGIRHGAGTRSPVLRPRWRLLPAALREQRADAVRREGPRRLGRPGDARNAS